MTLAIFDLDNTLIAGDSDHLWGDYLVARGIISKYELEAAQYAGEVTDRAGAIEHLRR